MTIKKGCNPKRQPKRVVANCDPTPAEIAERAAEIRKEWAGRGQEKHRSPNLQGMFRLSVPAACEGG